MNDINIFVIIKKEDILLEKDLVSKDIFKDKERFADIFNHALFNKKVVKPEQLVAVDSSEVYVDKKVKEGRARDIVMEMKNSDYSLAILAIENQAVIDNTMPIRVMNYDSLAYFEQVRGLKNNYLPVDQKLKPVITLIVYSGESTWKYPKSLHDILNIRENEVKEFVPNYPLYILDIQQLEHGKIEEFDTDIKLLFGIIKKLK